MENFRFSICGLKNTHFLQKSQLSFANTSTHLRAKDQLFCHDKSILEYIRKNRIPNPKVKFFLKKSEKT
jgi:hypothetical protein